MPFLRAKWRNLVMVNWSIPPDCLAALIPEGCVLDQFQGKTYVSLVAFLFEDTRVLGVAVPGHQNFEEVNLRFYVKHLTEAGEERRGVVFIREYVPKPMIAWVARTLYQEPYGTIPMSHDFRRNEAGQLTARYQWGKNWISGLIGESSQPLKAGSVQHFISEHYWGYTKTNRGTREYRVDHPSWTWRTFDHYRTEIHFESLYGSKWSFLSSLQPDCVFMADGSEVSVEPWGRLPATRNRELS